jgi:hypothetical protein
VVEVVAATPADATVATPSVTVEVAPATPVVADVTVPSVAPIDLTTVITDAVVTEAAAATTALFGEAKAKPDGSYMPVLVLTFIFIALATLYVSNAAKKSDDEETAHLHDYLLIKA